LTGRREPSEGDEEKLEAAETLWPSEQPQLEIKSREARNQKE